MIESWELKLQIILFEEIRFVTYYRTIELIKQSTTQTTQNHCFTEERLILCYEPISLSVIKIQDLGGKWECSFALLPAPLFYFI